MPSPSSATATATRSWPIGLDAELQRHLARARLELQQVEHTPQYAIDVDGGVGPGMLVLLDARQHQKVVDQAAHALGLLGHDAEEALARADIIARRAAQGL